MPGIGNHTVSETAGTGTSLSPYLSVIGGACAANGSVSLLPGDVKACTITNTKAGFVGVAKTFNGGPLSAADSFTFQLRYGADSTTTAGTLLETQTATGGNAGYIAFTTKLDPSKTYDLCEVAVKAGWNTSLASNPTYFPLFNSSGDNSTACITFTVAPGQDLVINVDNSRPPGGLSRTIGYWKNWSSCTGGGQTYELDKNLPVGVGNLTITTCPVGVSILDKRDYKTGKKMSSDPAYNLAAQYLAAALNYHVGALRCLASDRAVNSAEALLQTVNFLGTGTYANHMTALQASTANILETFLDGYNNNNVGWCFLTDINKIPLSPAITSDNTFTFTSGAFGTFNVTATGSPTLTLSESGSLPAGVTFNSGTGVLSGTTTAIGTYPITFKATNFATVTQSFTLIVQ